MIERLHFRAARELWSNIALSPRTRRVGELLTWLLLAAALALLQVLLGGVLISSLLAYGLIAIAAICSFATLRSSSRADLLCLGTSAILCGYIILRALTSPVSYVARADLYLSLAGLIFYGITATSFTRSSSRMSLIILLLTLAMVHVWLGLIQFGVGENFMPIPWLESLKIEQRASGFYLNPDHLAGLLEVLGILGLSITCWSRLPKWGKVITGYLTAACYLGLALTGSRGGYASALASLLVFTLLSVLVGRAGGAALYRKIGIGSLAALATVLIAGFWLISQSAYLSQRLGNVMMGDATRLDLWRAAIEQWKLQPLIGTGSGTYLFFGRQFRAERMQLDPVVVHNDYLQLLCEYGLVGLIAFGFFLAVHLHRGWRNFQRLGPKRLSSDGSLLGHRLALTIGALSAIAAYLVHSMVDFNMHIPGNALLMAFVFGLIANPGSKMGADIPRADLDFVPRFCVAALGAILLFQIVRLFPGQYNAECARRALEDERPTDAILFADKALDYDQQNPNVFFYLGRAKTALANQKLEGSSVKAATPEYLEALAAFDRARLLAPLDETYPLDMAFVYDQLGRFQEAEWMFSIARSLDPRSINIGELYKAHLDVWKNGAFSD